MRSLKYLFCVGFAATLCSLMSVASMGQSIPLVYGIAPDAGQTDWSIQVSFSPDPSLAKIKRIFLVNIEDEKIIRLSAAIDSGSGIYTYTPSEPLEMVTDTDGLRKFTKHYELKASVDKGDKILTIGAAVQLFDLNVAGNSQVRQKAKNIDESDVYISGQLNGAHKRKPGYTTEIKLQKYMPLGKWAWTPFFKLNASTDVDADPDAMEAGVNFRYVSLKHKSYFDNEFKLESERDFDNTNLVYGTRVTFLPHAFPKALRETKGVKIVTHSAMLFINPFIGGEFGKNLRSPLKAAEGDGIARLLAGTDLRLVFFIKKNEKAPDVEWTTSYIRRWLLTDELGFKADAAGNLQLRTFGTSPRDHFASKFSVRMNKFFDIFTAYEWGQVPPSYKLVDHRFRLGFAYKFKFGEE